MEETVIMNIFKTLPVAANNIRLWTQNYPLLNELKQRVLMGESKRPLQPELHPYWSGREQLTVEDGTLLWGFKSVILSQVHHPILAELYHGHPGVAN